MTERKETEEAAYPAASDDKKEVEEWGGWQNDNSEDHDKDLEEEEESSDYEHKKLSLAQACGLNTMNMFGTGPFITIPFVVAAAKPPGPQALIGYALAAFACMNDSLIWAELGSMWPDSGGSYVYLRELYGPNTWGRLIAFVFVWQIMVSGPMECASGFIATAQYIAYIDKTYTYAHHSLIAFGMCVATVWALYREIDEVGTITLVLWAFTIAAILFAIIAGFSTFETKYIETPSDAFDNGMDFFVSLGVAARFAVYDFTGYYDVNFVGKEVQNASKNIPIACVTTCCVVAIIFFLVDIAVIGSLEWDPKKGGYVELVTSDADAANYIMALFCETHISRGFAIFFTIIVCITIFGSCFSFMIGLAQIPYTAAKDGYFYAFLAHEHESYKGLQDYSLLFVGALSTIFCFCDLKLVIEGMLTMQLLVQFMAQGAGLMYYRYYVDPRLQEEAPFSVPWFPIPNIIQLVIFGFIFLTTDTYVFHGNAPLLEMALLFLFMGVVMYMIWARGKGLWPFCDEDFDANFEDELDQFCVYHDDYGQELNALKRKVDASDRRVKELRQETKGVSRQLVVKDNELQETINKLGQEEFKIVTKYRNILATENKIAELLGLLSVEEKKYNTANTENLELQTKINFIRDTYSDGNGHVDFGGYTQSKRGAMKSAIAELPVTEWGVQEVYFWWRTSLPKAAQSYIQLVKDCQVAGVDLLAVEEEMLAQYGMKKMCIHQVLKSIDGLKQNSYVEDDEDSEPPPHKLKRSASSRRGLRSKSRERGYRV